MARDQEPPGMVRERDESGRFRETVTKDGILALFDEVEGPVVLSRDVAEAFDCTGEAARQKLNELVEEGTLGTRKVGRTRVYWQEEKP